MLRIRATETVTAIVAAAPSKGTTACVTIGVAATLTPFHDVTTPRLVRSFTTTRTMALMCGTATSSRRPVASPAPSLLVKAEEAVAATITKAAALDADVAAGVAVAAIRAVAVAKDVADTDAMDKAVGAKVRTIKGTKAPTTRTMEVFITKETAAGPTTSRTPLRYSLRLRAPRAFTTCPYLAL